jgi:hypothetical protein
MAFGFEAEGERDAHVGLVVNDEDTKTGGAGGIVGHEHPVIPKTIAFFVPKGIEAIKSAANHRWCGVREDSAQRGRVEGVAGLRAKRAKKSPGWQLCPFSPRRIRELRVPRCRGDCCKTEDIDKSKSVPVNAGVRTAIRQNTEAQKICNMTRAHAGDCALLFHRRRPASRTTHFDL